MKGAVMQPYLFPYIGYYQLVSEVDKFVFFDDVNFIKKSFINRNSILLNQKKFEFSIPVAKVSQNRLIEEHMYTGDYANFFKTLKFAYRDAPNFHEIIEIVESVLRDGLLKVPEINGKSIRTVFDFLGLKKEFIFSSALSVGTGLKGQEKIIAICKELGITKYRNAIGGQKLYDKKFFSDHGIELAFIKTNEIHYSQSNSVFVPNLSIIDMLMWCTKEQVIKYLKEYSIE
jgi:hypothetical protein